MMSRPDRRDAEPGLREREIRIAKLALLARRADVSFATTLANTCLVTVLLYRSAPRLGLALWAGLQLVGCAVGYYRVHKVRRPPRGTARGLARAAWLSSAAGVTLGSVVLLVQSASDFARFIVFLTLGAMASAASTTLAAVPRAAQGYIAGALVLPGFYWLSQGLLEYAVLAGLAASMTVFLVRNARLSHEAFLAGLGRAREIESLGQQFQAERDEWLDLSRATEAFALLDEAGRLLLWNARFEQRVYPARPLRGVGYLALLAEAENVPLTVDGQNITRAGWLELHRQLADVAGEVLEGYADDEFHRVSAERLASGRQVVLAVNVSALQQAERALREGQLALLQAQRLESVGIIAGGVAHDFNNLLTTIGGASELLEGSVHTADDRALLADVAASVQRGAELTAQLLAFARRQARKPRPLALNELIARDLPVLSRLLPAHIRLETAFAAALPPIHADAEQLRQVVLNLVLNARDAMTGGGALRIQTRSLGAEVELCIEDTGTGMAPETHARIFEPFFTTKQGQRGSGLGLSAVLGILRQSGGSIDVDTELGRGTRVTVRLPRSSGAPLASVPSERPRAAAGAPPRVLVVDDEERVLDVTVRLLERLGYRTIRATDPNAALAVIETRGHELDLLLTDVVMPGMSGADLAIAARGFHAALPVLFMSGYNPGLLERFEGCEVLQKPFTLDQLAAAVHRVLGAPAGGAHPVTVSGFISSAEPGGALAANDAEPPEGTA